MIERYLYACLSPIGAAYGGQAPSDAPYPYIVFRQVSGTDQPQDVDTVSQSDRWQIDSYAGGDYSAGRALAKSINAAIDKRGLHNGICIHAVRIDGPEDLYNEQVEQHYQSSDVIVHYSE